MGEGSEEFPAFLFYEQCLCSAMNRNYCGDFLKVDLQTGLRVPKKWNLL